MKPRPRAGFTLRERTIAIVLLSIGLLALAGALARALHVTGEARALHSALREAEGVADSLSFQAAIEAGVVAMPGIALAWEAEPCALVTCARVTAMTPLDTLSLLTVVNATPGDDRR